jgi:poly-gamma-glutamate synthesis protein (capsule biosynthesis protein)
LDELEISHSGIAFHADERPYTTFTVDGVKFGFYAAAWGINSFVPLNPNVRMNALPPGVLESNQDVQLPEIRQALADMQADGCDFRVVALHWGYEFEYYPAPGVMRVGREAVRAGADLVLGTHPHVQQPCETLFVNGYEEQLPEPYRALAAEESTLESDGPPRKALIAYSMGNFATTMFTFACKVGLMLSLRVYRDASTGHVDWKPDACEFVVNVPRMPRTRERRLLMLDDYEALRERHGGIPHFEREHFAFLKQHLLGEPVSAR